MITRLVATFVVWLTLLSAAWAYDPSRWEEVVWTPWDDGIDKVYDSLRVVPGDYHEATDEDLAVVHGWILELHYGILYRKQPEWRSPEWVLRNKIGDCKCKALILYKWMRERGLDVMLVVGRDDMTDTEYHAWVIWVTPKRELVIDPTNMDEVVIKLNPFRLVEFFAYTGFTKLHRVGNPYH